MNKLIYFFKVLIMILMVILTFFYAITFNGELGWVMLVFTSSFFLVAFLGMLWSVKKLQIGKINEITTQVNEKQKISIEIKNEKNKTSFFPNLTIKNNELGLDQSFSLFLKKEKKLLMEWIPKKRTYIQSLEIELISSDFFGILKKRVTKKGLTTIYVLPKTMTKSLAVLQLLDPSIKKAMWGESTYDLEKVRLYQAGDSVKQIDWKLSSKKQKLIFREYETNQTGEILFLFYGVRSFYFERMLSVFFSLFQSFNRGEYSFTLLGNGVKATNEINLTDFAKITKSDDPGTIPFFKEECVVIFTPEITGRLEKELEKIDKNKIVQVIDYKTIERSLIL